MADTFSQINIHCVFAVKGRKNFIRDSFKESLFKYISGVLKNHGYYPLAVGGHKDHVHVFFELPPNKSVSEAMQYVKSVSSKWINDQKFLPQEFNWQNGYGAFSHARSNRDVVIKYIMQQEEHHKTKSFREEYLALLKEFEIEFQEEYLFEFYDD